MSNTHYEWVIETIDEHDDIDDVRHAATFAEACAEADGCHHAQPTHTISIGVVRNSNSYPDRQWAYLRRDGTLPERFDDGDGHGCGGGRTHVPKRFHDEVAKVLANEERRKILPLLHESD